RARALHEAMLADTLERVGNACRGAADLFVSWSGEPPASGEVADLSRPLSQEIQSGSTLGERMAFTLRSLRRSGQHHVGFIGSDSPHMPARTPLEAITALEDLDVVLGPAEDGGYYLLGVQGTHPELFTGIPWGTSEVLSATRRRLHEAGLRH